MSDEFWKSVLLMLGAMFGSVLLQLGAGYVARLRAPAQNRKDEAEAAANILRSADQLRVLYEDQFKDQQADIEALKRTNIAFQATQLQNQRRILELESQGRDQVQKIELLERSDTLKSGEIESLRNELAALYDYVQLIQKWARENSLNLPVKQRRADKPPSGVQ